MKTLQLIVEDNLYEILLAMFKGLPEKQIKIIEDTSIPVDINQFAGKIKSFSAIKDPVAWQREIRSDRLFCYNEKTVV